MNKLKAQNSKFKVSATKIGGFANKFGEQNLKLICVFSLTLICGCENRPVYKDTQAMMGTFVEVVSSHKQAANIVFEEFKRIEGLLSKYKPDSEISLLNRTGELKASPEVFYIIKRAKEFWNISDGAFDITVAPLSDIWGFTEKNFSKPKNNEIKSALRLVGSDKIILQDDNYVIKFLVSGMKIDLGSIAKGYAVDCAVRKLKENQIKSCLINAGGDIYCLGDKEGRPWRIAVKSPRKNSFIKYMQLKDKAVATSGDYEQYFFKNNKRYSHIFNPKTGLPANSGVVSVTVIAKDCLTADALATAVFVLGKKRGEKLINKFPEVKAYVYKDDLLYN